MKVLAVFAPCLIAVGLLGCGGGNSDDQAAFGGSATQTEARADRLAMTKAEIDKLPQFTVRTPPQRPRHLVIRDLREGFGAELKRGEGMLVEFAGAEYGYSIKTTPATRNDPEEFKFDEVVEGWKRGLPGMRVGGRRELIVPKRLSTGGDVTMYVVDLLAVYPDSR